MSAAVEDPNISFITFSLHLFYYISNVITFAIILAGSPPGVNISNVGSVGEKCWTYSHLYSTGAMSILLPAGPYLDIDLDISQIDTDQCLLNHESFIARMHGCVRNDSETHETVLLDCTTGNPVTPVECISLSFRIHLCVLAFITYRYILCTNGIAMALV